jgi:hypothetical protein
MDVEIVKDGAPIRSGSSQGEDLRFSSTEIPDGDLRRNRNLGLNACARQGSDLLQHALTVRFSSNLAEDRFRNEENVRELTQESDVSSLAEENQEKH